MEVPAQVCRKYLIPFFTCHLGKSLVVKYIVESLYRRGFNSQYVQHYVVPRDFMHDDPVHLQEYRVKYVL